MAIAEGALNYLGPKKSDTTDQDQRTISMSLLNSALFRLSWGRQTSPSPLPVRTVVNAFAEEASGDVKLG